MCVGMHMYSQNKRHEKLQILHTVQKASCVTPLTALMDKVTFVNVPELVDAGLI